MGRKPTKKVPDKKDEKLEFFKNLILFGLEGLKQSGVLARYKKAIDYYNGQHEIKDRSKSKGNYVDNKFAEVSDNRLAHITDARPKWMFLPQEESDLFTALALNQILGDVIWDFIEWDDRAEESVQDATFAGSTHIKTIGADVDTGFPIFDICECGSVIPDPKATRKEELRYIIHVTAKDIPYIRRQYSNYDIVPEMELDKIALEQQSSSPELSWYTQVTSEGGATFPWVFPVMFSHVGQYKMENIWPAVKDGGVDKTRYMLDSVGKALIWEIYLDDPSVEKIPFDPKEVAEEHVDFSANAPHAVIAEENHVEHLAAHNSELEKTDSETQPRKYALLQRHITEHSRYEPSETRAKYPRGRLVTLCQGKVLRDEPNPLPIEWRDIFIKWDVFKNRRSYWGKSLVSDLFDLQDMLNHRRNMIHQNINMCTNGVVKVSRRLGEWAEKNKAKFNNLLGKVWIMDDPDKDLVVDFGAPLPQHFFQELVSIEQTIDRRSGNEDLSSGRYPQGSPPGITVSQLLQEGKTVVRMILRHYAHALKQMARNAIAIMVENVSPDMSFRIMGEDNQPQFVKWKDLRDRAGLLDIRVDVATMLSSSRQERFRQAVELAQAGVYDAMAVLDAIDDPKKYEVAQRINAVNQLQQQNELLVQKNEEMEKRLNTLMNRLQSETGEGNVGQ